MIFLFHLTRFIRKLLLGFVLLLALVVSAARILLPEINEYRAEVVSSLSASIGKPIEMDSMAAGLSGIHPEVVLNGVKIIDPREKKVVLRFEQLRAGLNVREFLATGSFQPRWVTIRGAKLSIRRSLDGSIRLIGLESGEEMPKWIFEDGRFELLDSEVDWQDLEYPTAGLHFSRADIRLLNTEIRHKVAIDVDLPQRFGRSLSIRMDVEGDLLRQECCTGRIYVRARDIRYDRLLEGFSPETNGLPRGKGDFRLWSNWEKSVPLAFVGEAEIRREGWSPASGNGGYSSGIAGLRRLSGVFHWVRDPAGWTFSVRRFALDSGDVSWPLTDWALKMKRDPASEKAAYYFNASYLRLDEIGKLLAESGIATPEYGRTVAALVPGGEIFDLQLGYAESAGNDLLWFLCGRFENVRFKPWQSYPGARNLSGKVCGDRDRGWFQVRATRPQFEFPGVFRAPIDLAILRGNFAWARDGQFVTIRSERVESIAPAFVADFRMRWQIPLDGDGSFLDLQGEFENVNASSVPRYLPVGILKKPLIAWLDNAFLSGRASRGGVVFRGPVAAFPFHGGEGVFETLFFTKDVVLAYHPAWPVIHSDNAEVRFYQAGMELSARHATVSGIPVEDVRGHCDNFETADYLKVTGRAKATLGQGINFLKQTPLGALYEPLLEFVSLHGDSRVDLALNIPIGPKTEDLDVKGAIVLKKARVAAFGTQLERVTGRLEFSPERIHGNAIRGELLGYPVVVDLADNARGLAVQIKGSIATKSLAERFPSAPWGYFDGATDYSIDLQIPKLTEKLYADIDIYSDLRGIRILLPEPLQKAAEIPRRFNAKTHLVPGRGFPLEVMYGKIARARLNWITASDGFHWEQGDIKLGRTAPTEIPAEGLSFYADLEKLDLGPWKSFLASMDPDGEMHSGLLNLVDVQIDHLRLDDFEIGPFTLRMQRNHGVWGGFTESQLARGRFGAMDQARQNSGLDMAFEYLRIPQQTSSKKKTSQGAFRWDPRSIVDLNVKADHFYWKAVDYGKLELVTSRKVDGMNIEQLNIRQKGLDLSLSGSWTASDSIDRTSISGRLAIDNLGDFLTRIGKSNVIRDSDVKSTVSLNWNDPLYDLRSETLFGSAQVEFGQGRLLTVEPGLGRVFGLFNLDGLKNLLLFDFGKLFGQGMAFEQVTSAFLLREGHATITRLSIDAVPAELSVAGEIDLVGERLHGNVTVVPKGVVAAGASMLLTQELPGSAVDGLINREYQVSGKWDNPEIVRLPGSGKRL